LQTKLRIAGFLIVANALSISPTFGAPVKTKAVDASKSLKMRYVGTASWYGKRHEGRKMANGKCFDSHKLTAASWYFPLGTTVRVVNLKNGQSVVVTVTDRGPGMHLHRLIDLSEAAAERLGYVGQGLTSVALYPVVPVQTQPARMDVHLVGPSTLNPAAKEVTASSIPM
jgi:rare lipoprotein A (peptidoglycan hydrolase)